MMNATTVARQGRPGLVAAAWGLGILLATAFPLGGFAVAVAAVLTTYRASSRGTRVAILVVGVATVLLQLGTLVTFGSSSGTGVPHPVG
jgi:hypothetical protein